MFRHIQIVEGQLPVGVSDSAERKQKVEDEVRLAMAAPEMFNALYLCYRTLLPTPKLRAYRHSYLHLSSASHEMVAVDAARQALIAATGEEP